MTDTTDGSTERETGNLAACGKCANDGFRVYLHFSCEVHGSLAEWLTTNVDPKIVEKVTDAARSHERAAAAWAEMTGSVADLFERMAKGLRRDDR